MCLNTKVILQHWAQVLLLVTIRTFSEDTLPCCVHQGAIHAHIGLLSWCHLSSDRAENRLGQRFLNQRVLFLSWETWPNQQRGHSGAIQSDFYHPGTTTVCRYRWMVLSGGIHGQQRRWTSYTLYLVYVETDDYGTTYRTNRLLMILYPESIMLEQIKLLSGRYNQILLQDRVIFEEVSTACRSKPGCI